MESASLKVQSSAFATRDLHGYVTPAKAARSATVKGSGVDEGIIAVNLPATFR
jgi:hypothetical protein